MPYALGWANSANADAVDAPLVVVECYYGSFGEQCLHRLRGRSRGCLLGHHRALIEKGTDDRPDRAWYAGGDAGQSFYAWFEPARGARFRVRESAVMAQPSPARRTQSTGCKVGEMTTHSARVWMRRTAASQRLANGIV